MIKFRNSKSQRHKQREFILSNNIQEIKLPYYDSIHDPHLSNYFYSRRYKITKKSSNHHPIHSIYNSDKCFSASPDSKPSQKLPGITRLNNKNFKPLTAEQFKNVILKYRKYEKMTEKEE